MGRLSLKYGITDLTPTRVVSKIENGFSYNLMEPPLKRNASLYQIIAKASDPEHTA
jgi:hypothetical protein